MLVNVYRPVIVYEWAPSVWDWLNGTKDEIKTPLTLTIGNADFPAALGSNLKNVTDPGLNHILWLKMTKGNLPLDKYVFVCMCVYLQIWNYIIKNSILKSLRQLGLDLEEKVPSKNINTKHCMYQIAIAISWKNTAGLYNFHW